MKILFLAPYPLNEAPSQRFRFELFLEILDNKNIGWDFKSFMSEKEWNILYKKGHFHKKALTSLSGFGRRFKLFLHLSHYKYIFIHRELTPLGPPLFEWLIAKAFGKKIIYDFDDAIWLADPNNENLFWKGLKWRSKVRQICKWSWKVTVGNEFLAQYASHYCDQVVVFPTVIDPDIHQPKRAETGLSEETEPKIPQSKAQKPVIGWTGSHSTLFYLDQIVPVLQDLEKEYDFEFLVIANKNPKLPLRNFRFIEWNKETEIEDLARIDIGIMPLENHEWAKGKCGFKLIQYLALEIPAIASPVGVNTEIIRHGEDGFLTNKPAEWLKYLITFLENPELRTNMGKAGRALVKERYSVPSQQEKFLKLFE